TLPPAPPPTLFPYTTLFRSNLLSLSHKFPNLKNDQALSRRVDDGLNQAFKDAGLSFDRDIKPWLGSRLAVAATIGERTAGLVLRSEEHTSELQSRENLVCRL